MERAREKSRRRAVLLIAGLALGGCYSGGGGSPSPTRSAPRTGGAGEAENGTHADTASWRDTAPATVQELLLARFPGVEVIGRGPYAQIRIRGTSSLVASTEPLFVIDGMPAAPGAGLLGINPQDVASIEVLRDAGSTAMWGVQGANGVIVITTKRGPR